MIAIDQILRKDNLTKSDIIALLQSEGDERKLLFKKSMQVKAREVGRVTYYRGLVEMTNICEKNCYYCGIRKGNAHVDRYFVRDEEVLNAAKFAYENQYGSMVIQTGEMTSTTFINRIDDLLKEIKRFSNGELGITLSCGEQSLETYERWFKSGAHRYLLRVESSNQALYESIHPKDALHSFASRIEALHNLRKVGYQVGTGVMVGIPGQRLEHLADDLLFMQTLDIDMCGMGPYIEHEDTPLYSRRGELWPLQQRFDLTLKMIAVLRLLMKNINIAAATALQAIDKIGREKALKVGANVLMPNVTPGLYRNDYALYQGKPCTDENAADCKNCLEARISIAGDQIGYGKWGDAPHFKARNSKK